MIYLVNIGLSPCILARAVGCVVDLLQSIAVDDSRFVIVCPAVSNKDMRESDLEIHITAYYSKTTLIAQ